VIAFFCCLLQRYHISGPHLVVMPLSVLSSWKEDISRYCSPTICPYVHLGNKEEREVNFQQWLQKLRSLKSSNNETAIQVCLTTYDMTLKDSSLFNQLSGKKVRRSSSSSLSSVTWSYIVVSLFPFPRPLTAFL
jgi:chromodomain-helicase-DNA-binding protein 1-like